MNRPEILFIDDDHENFFVTRRTKDVYKNSAVYLMGLTEPTRRHAHQILTNEGIEPKILLAAWQTGTTLRICRLLFNLWNGYAGEGYPEEDGTRPNAEPAILYSPSKLFDYDLQQYFWEAIKIRYDIV